MPNLETDTSAVMRQVVQAVCDLTRRPLTDLRILDLGCAHGHYAFELAQYGAQVLGIEGRASWLAQARRAKDEAAVTNVTFVQDDVRNLSKEKYGEFDVVLCLGLLYHLDAPDLFEFLHSVYEVCGDFALIETHFAPRPKLMREWGGKQYWGVAIQEHVAGSTPAEKRERVGASLDNEYSFWLTRPSLYNVLQHVGFSSVYECRAPLAYLGVGPERTFKMWGNRTLLAAMKGRPLNRPGTVVDWPEDMENHLLEQYLAEQQSSILGKIKGGLRRLLRRFLYFD